MTHALSPLVSRLAALTELPETELRSQLSEPPTPDLGDYAFPCFQLAKKFRRSPVQIAGELAARLKPDEVVAEARAVGPYVNIRLAREPFIGTVLSEIREQGERFGATPDGGGRPVVIDYSSPNMAKPFHVGHLSSTIIGGALARLLTYQGYRVVRVNHLGDWGTPVGQQIVAFRRWGDEQALERHPISHMVELYQRFHREKEQHPELEDEGREWFRRLEAGDAEARSFWERIRHHSIAELERAYARLGVGFDHYQGEAFYEGMLEETVQRVVACGITAVSDGALVVALDSKGIKTPLMLRKSDGATIYATRDLAAAMYRAREFEFEWCLYVVAHDQELHFEQLFATLELMGFEWANRCVHVQFGRVHGMSTRRGGAILLDELLDRAVSKVLHVIRENQEALFTDLPAEETDGVAEAVGVGAITFGTLNRRRVKDVTFSWDAALTFTGESGPYVQYAHARLCSIVRKAGRPVPDRPEVSLLTHDAEWAVVKELARFPDQVRAACSQYEPSYVARYLLDLAQTLTRFYDQCRVIGNDEALTGARLAVVDAARQVIRTGLGLLCMKAPDRM